MASENGNGRPGAVGAALDVLLTDAAMGNPAVRVLRSPAPAVAATAKIAGRPDRAARRAFGLGRDLAKIATGRSEIAPRKGDKRFADKAWAGNPLFRRLMQSYIAVGDTAIGLVDDAELEWRADTVARFMAGNVHDFLSPTNVPFLNPAVMKETFDQGGSNLVKGLRRAVRDIGARRLPAMVDTSKFEVGGNVAVTEGSVVLKTDVFELIQYQARAKRVREVPVLFVPPTINKYYVLDLAPGRSLVAYLLEQGFNVFMVSWRNPDETHADFDFDTYAAAIIEARDAVAEIAGSEKVNLSAACSGGLLAAGALAHLAKEGALKNAGTLTLMVAALDANRAGTASAIANRELAATAVAESARKGYLESAALANVFAWLRPNDLIWGYVVNNYLMGKPPPAFDILYWNQDGVRLSAGLHRDFVHMALDNLLVEPGGMEVLDTPIDISDIDLDTFVIAGINDHIVPWDNAYRGAQALGGKVRFVLSTSGHIQALINPPGPESRSSYRLTDAELTASPADFVRDTPTTSGSWWPNYAEWLHERSGALKAARKTLGSSEHRPTADAPGTYVLAN